MAERMMEGAGVPLEIDRTPIPEERLDRFGPAPPEPLPLDTLLARARAAIPGLEIKHIWLPEHADMPLFVRGQATAQLVRDRGNGAQLDPYTGDVLAAYTAEALPPLPRWVQTADPLHFGDFGGLATKVLWFLCGTGMCGIMAVGAVVYGRRTADAIGRSSPGRPRDARRRATASLRDVRAALRFRHMGRWRLPAALAVSAVPAVAYLTWWAPQFESRVEATALPAAPVGPWTVSARTDHPLPPAPGEGLSWRLRFCPGCYKSVRSAWVAFGNAEGPTSAPVRVLGSPNELQATIKAPAAIAAEGLHLWVIVKGWNGSRYRASWTIQATHGSLR